MSPKSIKLTKYVQSDFALYHSLVKEDNLMRYITGKGLTIEQARQKFESIMAINAAEPEIGYFKIHNHEGEFIGDSKLEWCKKDRSKLEIGYLLKEAFWGKRYGTMVCTKLLSLAEKGWPTVDVIGIIDPENVTSKKLLEKFGFKRYFIGVEDDLPTEKLILKR